MLEVVENMYIYTHTYECTYIYVRNQDKVGEETELYTWVTGYGNFTQYFSAFTGQASPP